MMFRRKVTEVDLTTEAYARWLRAQRPPFEWFLRQSDDDQEAMAYLGDVYVQGVTVAVGQSVADPELAELGVAASAGDVDAEASLATKLAERMAGRMEKQAAQPPRHTFGGLGERQEVKDLSRRKTRRMPEIFGSAPAPASSEAR